MPLSQAPPDALLPHIDPPLDAASLASAQALIEAELASSTEHHPSLPALRAPNFPAWLQESHTLLSSATDPKPSTPTSRALDLSRYDLPDLPLPSSDAVTQDLAEQRATALQRARISAEYLARRGENLALLETYGKNAWLIANATLEDELRSLEREVEGARAELEELGRERERRQRDAQGEMVGLEDGWRQGVGRMIEVLAAGEKVRVEVLERKRAMAAGG